MPDCFTLSANDNILSYSSSEAFIDLESGQKKMLIPDGVSGRIHRNSQFQRQETKVAFGLKAMSSVDSL